MPLFFYNPSVSHTAATSLYTREALGLPKLHVCEEKLLVCTNSTSVAGAAGADTARLKFPDSLDEPYLGMSHNFSFGIRLAQTNYI